MLRLNIKEVLVLRFYMSQRVLLERRCVLDARSDPPPLDGGIRGKIYSKLLLV